MDMGLTKDDLDVRERSREFAREFLYPNEEELDENENLPDTTKERIRQAVLEYRLNAINHAKEFGGQGMTIVQQCIVNEEVGSATNAL
jgi:acyl-CoA dehydrogenase